MKIENAHHRKTFNDLKKVIKSHYGPKCMDFYFDCFSCKVFMALDIIEEAFLCLQDSYCTLDKFAKTKAPRKTRKTEGKA
jgi:hypothetical protein